jgi:hypothetical protein
VAEGVVVLGRSGRGSSGTSRCRFWLGGDPLSMTSVEWYDYVGGREAPPLTDPHPNPFPSLGARSAPSPGAPRVFFFEKGETGSPGVTTADQPRIFSVDPLAARRRVACPPNDGRARSLCPRSTVQGGFPLSDTLVAAANTTTRASASRSGTDR